MDRAVFFPGGRDRSRGEPPKENAGEKERVLVHRTRSQSEFEMLRSRNLWDCAPKREPALRNDERTQERCRTFLRITRVKEILAYWLVPAEPYQSWFAEEISRITALLDAPAFTPHLTVHSGITRGGDSPASVVQKASNGVEPLSLRPTNIGHSEEFTKTLYIEFAETEALAQLSRRLGDVSSPPGKYEFHPHLSLAYQHLTLGEREVLARSVVVPCSEVLFDEIQAVVCPSPTQSAEHVRAWRVCHRHRLTARDARRDTDQQAPVLNQ